MSGLDDLVRAKHNLEGALRQIDRLMKQPSLIDLENMKKIRSQVNDALNLLSRQN